MTKYRIVKLDGLERYRVEYWDKSHLWGLIPAQWRPAKTYVPAGWGSGPSWEHQTFHFCEDARKAIRVRELIEREVEAETRNLWHEVTCG